MLDHFHTPTPFGSAEVFYFEGSEVSGSSGFITWQKPRGKSMASLLLVGAGSNGGAGFVGAAGAAGGGAGGGSGGVVYMRFPLYAIPDTLFLQLALTGGTGTSSRIVISPDLSTSMHVFALANSGRNLVAAASATAGGTGGAGALAATASNMPLGWQWVVTSIAGQQGSAGGFASAGSNLALPVTGILSTAGAGGGGLPAAGVVGFSGGAITGAGAFPTLSGGAGGSAATTPPVNGSNGYRPIAGLMYGYGGTGGGSSHGSATGAGLFGGNGGDGAPGCGGGGGGGCLTGGTAGVGGRGGPAFCIITCW